MREPRPDATYGDPNEMPVSTMFPELFAADACGWAVTVSVHGQPVASLVSPDVARAAFDATGMSDVAGDLPSNISWPDLCAEALVRQVVYLTHAGRVAAVMIPYDVAQVGQRQLRDSPSTGQD